MALEAETFVERGAWIVGIDVGGTFTDLVAVRHGSVLASGKILTTYPDPTAGILAGLDDFRRWGLVAADCESVVHATTLASNTLLQGQTSRTGLVTTAGFADVLWLARENRYDIYALENPFPPVIARRGDRVEVDERVAFDGTVVRAPQLESVLPRVETFIDDGVEAWAVCFLHSYANPEHELAVASAIQERWPHIHTVPSHSVLGEAREYERFVSTVLDAALHAQVAAYLRTLSGRLHERGYACGHYAVTSAGDAVTLETAADRPILLLESGPAAGHVAACRISSRIHSEVISFDVGGTTAKVGVSHAERPMLTAGLEVARVAAKSGSGYPVGIRSIDLKEVGSGGGSIAFLDSTGLLEVGPESAGSDPGPACFGLGGVAPTVTDANLQLRCLDPQGRLGGTLELDCAAAENALGRLDPDPDAAASAIRRIVDGKMAEAMRLHVVESHVDPTQRVLVASGGGGPLHAAAIATALGIDRIYCPREAGVLSAWGMALAPLALRTSLTRFVEPDAPSFSSEWADAWKAAAHRLGLTPEQTPLAFERTVEMLYDGQAFSIYVNLGRVGEADEPLRAEELCALFADAYRQRYDRDDQRGRTVISAFHLSAVLREEQPLISVDIDGDLERCESARPHGERRVVIDGREVLAAVISWPGPAERWLLEGPAIVQSAYTAAIVPPGWVAGTIGAGDLCVQRVGRGATVSTPTGGGGLG